MIITEVGKHNVAHPRIMGRGADRLIGKAIEHKLDLTRPDEPEKQNKRV